VTLNDLWAVLHDVLSTCSDPYMSNDLEGDDRKAQIKLIESSRQNDLAELFRVARA
jgi:hypothetical protein